MHAHYGSAHHAAQAVAGMGGMQVTSLMAPPHTNYQFILNVGTLERHLVCNDCSKDIYKKGDCPDRYGINKIATEDEHTLQAQQRGQRRGQMTDAPKGLLE